ncbi:BatB protein (fragment) [Candidatus Zixiibacteriota bacterium]
MSMRKTMFLFFVLGFAFAASPAAPQGFKSLVNQGNELFKKGDYKKALDLYHQAEADQPENPELYYNIGSALYKEGKYEEATDRLQKSFVTQDIKYEAMAHYNLGDVYFKAGDYQNAIKSFQKSLELNPDDIDAKYNLELARKRLKEQLKPEQNKNNQQKQNQQDQQKQDQDQQDKNKQDQKQEQQNKQDQQKKNEQKQQQQVSQNEMSKEDAERILNALKDDEEEVQKDVRRLQGPSTYEGNDW